MLVKQAPGSYYSADYANIAYNSHCVSLSSLNQYHTQIDHTQIDHVQLPSVSQKYAYDLDKRWTNHDEEQIITLS